MKGFLSLKVLEFLEEVTASTGEILDAFLTDYATSYRRLRGLERRRVKRTHVPRTLTSLEKHRGYELLSRLRRQGFVEKAQEGMWGITERGTAWIQKLRARMQRAAPLTTSYVVEQSPE